MLVNLPVRERAFRAVVEALEEIQKVNGYNFDVRHVLRKRTIPERAQDPPEIHLLVGPTVVKEGRNNMQNYEEATAYLWFMIKDTGNDLEDVWYTLFVNDMLKCIGDYQVVDTSGPKDRIVDIYLREHLPRYADTRTGLIVGRLEIGIGYCYLKGRPDLWDSDDTAVTVEV